MPDAQEPDDEEEEQEKQPEENEACLALLGLERAAAGPARGTAGKLFEAGIGECGRVEPMMGAGAAVDQQFVALGPGPLGGDAGRFLDDPVELLHALLEFFLLLDELALALIQRGAGFAGTSA